MPISDQTKSVAEAMTALWKGGFPATVRVLALASVRDEGREYQPDGKVRSAWELALHIATADLWFLESIERGAFHFDAEAAKTAEAQFQDVKAVVALYDAEIPAAIRRLRQLSGDQLAEDIHFFGKIKAR